MQISSWSASQIHGLLMSQSFVKRHKCIYQNSWKTGFEADVLIVRYDLKLIDIEIKVDVMDFKADQHKDKWWEFGSYFDASLIFRWGKAKRRDWPPNIWKHYYCLPADIWKEKLTREINGKSGILLIHDDSRITVYRPSRSNPYQRELLPFLLLAAA